MNGTFIPVRCPWESSHTTVSDDTATVWFLAGGGGFEKPAFRCLHAHCESRTTAEFLDAIGYTMDGMGTIDDTDEIEIQRAFDLKQLEEDRKVGVSPTEGPRFDRDKTGILWSLHNVVEALRHVEWGGLVVSWDSFTDQIMVREEGSTIQRPLLDLDYTNFAIRITRRGFKKTAYPIQMIRAAFYKVAYDNSYDSAAGWLTGLPKWDGTPRIERFCSRYLGAPDTEYARAVSLYWWTAHAGRILDPGCQADMSVVLISGQGTGKTSAVKSMIPFEDWFCELSLTERDADLSRAMRGKAIGEIAELRGLSGRDHEAIKAWVSRRTESWVPKFMEQGHTFKRRLVLVGTSNNSEFLADETGHRRWLPIEVGGRQDRDRIIGDREQLWAEAAHNWRMDGVLWEDAQTKAQKEHAAFEVSDPWEAQINTWLATEGLGGERPADREFLTVYEVLSEAMHIEGNKMQIRDKHRIGQILRTLGYRKQNIRKGDSVIKGWKKYELNLRTLEVAERSRA